MKFLDGFQKALRIGQNPGGISRVEIADVFE
jgi:hypothetical protein